MVEEDGAQHGQAGVRSSLPSSLSSWLGVSREVRDSVTPRLMASFRATLPQLTELAAVPLGLHWCLAPDVVSPDELGRDGHPRAGLFLPPMPLPRRMWAGGELSMHSPLLEGDAVTRVSTVEEIAPRHGRTGSLWFLTLRHLWQVKGETRIDERQDLVYRADPAPGLRSPVPPRADVWPDTRRWHLTPDATLLFRFSALSFNGHRIHYDQHYATAIEGYAALVVHGPLQATWLLNRAADEMGCPPTHFQYRNVAPLTVDEPVTVEAIATTTGLELRVRRDADGAVTMSAHAMG